MIFMKKHLVLFLLSLTSILTFAQGNFWETLNSPPGGMPYEIVRTENGWLYATSYSLDFVYRSIDEGENWDLVFNPIDIGIRYERLTISPNGAFYIEDNLTNGKKNVFKSVNSGMTWDTVEIESNIFAWIESSTGILFGLTDTIIQDTIYHNILKSNNFGQTWQIIFSSENISFDDLLFDYNNKLIASSTTSNPQLITNDEGINWDTLHIENAKQSLIVLPSGKYISKIDIGSTQTHSYRVATGEIGSNDFNIVYPYIVATNDTFNHTYTRPLLLNDGRLLIGQGSEIFISEDEGETWALWSNKGVLNDFPLQHQLPSGKIFANYNNSLFASINNGATWEPSANGLSKNVTHSMKFTKSPPTLWSANPTGLFKTQDDGETWVQITNNYESEPEPGWQVTDPKPTTTNFTFDKFENLYVTFDKKLYYSTDGGITLTNVPLPFPGMNDEQFVNSDTIADAIYVSKNSGAFRSTDGGATWTQISVDIEGYLKTLSRHPSGRLFAIFTVNGTNLSTLHFSDDNGLNWIKSQTFPNQYIYHLFIHESGTIYTDNFKSDDNGMTWVNTNIQSTADILGNKDIGVVYITVNGIFISKNDGLNWTQLPSFVLQNQLSIFVPYFGAIDINNKLIVSSPYLNLYNLIKTTYAISNGAHLHGNAATSDDALCTTIDPVAPLKNTIIKAQGAETWYTTTDTLVGNYQMFLDTGNYQVSAQLPLPFLWDNCSISVNMPVEGDTTYADLSVPALVECPFVTMELTIPTLERCFERDIYLKYCNHGSASADSVVLFLELDPLLSISNPAQPWALVDTANINLPCYPRGLDSNAVAWYLPIGSLDISECAQLAVPILVDCNAEPGQTHCITAYSCPDDLCINSQNWSGANIEVDARCEGDSVQLSIRNSGTAPSQVLPFVVIEDDVVLFDGGNSYQIDEAKNYTFPTNGEYFRIESDQEPGHPFPQQVAAWYVGCNGDPLPSSEFVNQFPTMGGYASEDTDCAPNTGSYDPNDKQGLPLGYSNDHLIERGVDIEYLIRFQNTGTAPAHKVVVRDTLSPFLDPGSVRVGAGSHPFTWSLTGEGVLVFTFDNINLPDSSANEAASHGFASFRIAQKPALPLGTDIYNDAAIYFDFNPPIITNQTHHQIGEDFLEIINITDDVQHHSVRMSAIPNPAIEQAIVPSDGAVLLSLYNAQGILMRSIAPNQEENFVIEKEGLQSGFYFIALLNEHGTVVGGGNVVFQ